MNPQRRRTKRAIVLLLLALACGSMAAADVSGRASEAERRVGPVVPVLIAKRDLSPETRIDESAAGRVLEVREVPARFVPPDALSDPAEAVGLRTAAPVPAGGYVTAGHLGGGGDEAAGRRLRAGERAVEVRVAGGADLAAAGSGRVRVDVVVTSEPREGVGRTYVALEDVELLSGRPAAEGEAAAPEAEGAGGETVATLRVTLRQAVFLTAAQNFAREVRLLPRTPGERRGAGRAVVSAGDL